MCVFAQSEVAIEFCGKLAFQRYLFCKILTSAAKSPHKKSESGPDYTVRTEFGPDLSLTVRTCTTLVI